jgi:flagellar basal body-associated protein FliL
MSALWIAVIIFIVIAVGAGLTQIFFQLGDKRHGDDVSNDESRLHTSPDEPDNPSSSGR